MLDNLTINDLPDGVVDVVEVIDMSDQSDRAEDGKHNCGNGD